MKHRPRTGFSLIEMVIVILILGIVAAAAAPRLVDTVSNVQENTTRRQLLVLRNAIEMYRDRSGTYPPVDSLPAAMATILDGPFPAPLLASVRGDSDVYYDTDSDVRTPVAPDSSKAGGWAYKPANGSLQLNVSDWELGADW